MFKFKVVTRIILGFISLGLLLFLTNVSSFVGLSYIRQSAESVINDKMPLQQQMVQVQTQLLYLGKLSLRDYYLDDLAELTKNYQKFTSLQQTYRTELQTLSEMVLEPSAIKPLNRGSQASKAYFDAVENMYELQAKQHQSATNIASATQQNIDQANDATALLFDIEFLENGDSDLELQKLVGQGNNIDIQLGVVLNNFEDLQSINPTGDHDQFLDELSFAFSNLEEAVEFLKRSSQDVDTDGLISAFDEQWQVLSNGLMGVDGLLNKNKTRFSEAQQALQYLTEAEAHLNTANTELNILYGIISKQTLAGQRDIIAEVENNSIIGIVSLLLGVSAVVIVAFIVTRIIRQPLRLISRSIEVISSGDLTHKANDENHCEFGDLARQLNVLSASLQGLIAKIRSEQDHLLSASSKSADLGRKTIAQVDKQLLEVTKTAENTRKVRDSSKNNVNQINYGTSKLNDVVVKTNNALDAVSETRKQILTQAQQSQESGKILKQF